MPVQLKLLLATLFWGATPTIGRILAEYEAPYVLVFGRFFFAALFLSWFCYLRRESLSIDRRWWPRLLLLGATGILLHNGLLFQAVEHTNASTASIILGLIAVQVVVLDLVIYRIWPDRLAVVGVIVGFIGVGLVVSQGEPARIAALELGVGESLAFLSGLSWAAYSVIGRGVLEDHSPLTVTTLAAWVGLVLLSPFLLEKPDTTLVISSDPIALLLMLLLGLLATALGFLWYYQGVSELGSVGAAVFMNLVPLGGLVWASVLLGEKLSLATAGGGALVIASLMLVNRPDLSGFRRPPGEQSERATR